MSCSCWTCRRSRGPRAVAPRLAAAWDALRRDDAERSRQRGTVHRLEALVAHRELQLLRAGRTRDRRYVSRRQAKLRDAERKLRRARRYLGELAA